VSHHTHTHTPHQYMRKGQRRLHACISWLSQSRARRATAFLCLLFFLVRSVGASWRPPAFLSFSVQLLSEPYTNSSRSKVQYRSKFFQMPVRRCPRGSQNHSSHQLLFQGNNHFPWGDHRAAAETSKQGDEAEHDLSDRGLCLVPVSWTPQVYRDGTAMDYWTPAYRGCLYRWDDNSLVWLVAQTFLTVSDWSASASKLHRTAAQLISLTMLHVVPS
jgi:hypothetical protein